MPARESGAPPRFPVTLITGAAGNLGGLLARHLVGEGRDLRLMVHRRPLSFDLAGAPGVSVVTADLADPKTLPAAVRQVEVVVHFAGVLFAPRPERFLPETAWLCELFGLVVGKPSPLTRDFIRIGRVSYWGDTRRTREELIPHLMYPTLEAGLATLS